MVTDYLWDEVLGRQSAQTRLFLLRTSITERVSGELADELTGEPGAAMMLGRLSRESGFVEALSHEHGQYRYHPLLRGVLVAELHRQIPHEVPVLLRRAARWHAAHGQPVEAVRCAAQAGDWDYAAHVLAEAGVAALLQSGAAELQAVLALFPPTAGPTTRRSPLRWPRCGCGTVTQTVRRITWTPPAAAWAAVARPPAGPSSHGWLRCG